MYVICTIYGVLLFLLCSSVLCFYELLQKVTRSTTTTFKLIERDARVEKEEEGFFESYSRIGFQGAWVYAVLNFITRLYSIDLFTVFGKLFWDLFPMK